MHEAGNDYETVLAPPVDRLLADEFSTVIESSPTSAERPAIAASRRQPIAKALNSASSSLLEKLDFRQVWPSAVGIVGLLVAAYCLFTRAEVREPVEEQRATPAHAGLVMDPPKRVKKGEASAPAGRPVLKPLRMGETNAPASSEPLVASAVPESSDVHAVSEAPAALMARAERPQAVAELPSGRGRTRLRDAVDAVGAGDYQRASALYEVMAAESEDGGRDYREVARILKERPRMPRR